MYGIEIIVSLVICVLFSGLAVFLARRSLTSSDDIAPKEDTKPRNKATKKSPKAKLAKKETEKPTNIKKDEEVTNVPPQKNTKKVKKAKAEVTMNAPTTSSDRVRTDSTDDWRKVSKPVKKVGKKENKVDIKEENVSESADIDTPLIITHDIQEPISAIEKTTKLSKAKKTPKQDSAKLDIQQPVSTKETKKETAKESEVKPKQNKETIATEEITKGNVSEDMELRHRVGELMSDLDREKSTHREENKSHIQLITQLNKEVDTLKQKMKVSQLNEEKLTEDIKKKNSSYSDIKQQFVIVQSELTKNIIQVQTLNREKDKLENRAKSIDESNRQLIEKSEMFDKVNSEKDSLIQRLTSVEEELKTTTARYNELSKTKEAESNEKINHLQSERQRMQEQLVRVQNDLIENNSKLQSMQQELLNTKNTYTDLLNENIHLQKSCSALENANVLLKQQQSSDMNVRDRETSEQLRQLMAEIDSLKLVNEQLTGENQKVESLTQELNKVQRLLSETNTDSGNHKETFDKSVAEINELKTENDSLKSSVEHYKTELENTESAILKLQTSFSEEETKWRESSLRLETEAAKKVESLIQENNDLNQRLSQTTIDTGNDQETHNKVMVELNELRIENEGLSSKVEHYKSGLENTESILSNLQVSVNEEEAKWRESLLKSESEAEKCSKELETVYNELMRIRNQRVEKNELNFAYHCVDKSLSSLIDEMEARMSHFESSLEAVIQERDTALAQVHVQINGTVSESVDSHSNVNGDSFDSEMTKIKEDLLNKVELVKSLESRCNKYKALIDIGTDALDAEKTQVQILKDKLKMTESEFSAPRDEQLS